MPSPRDLLEEGARLHQAGDLDAAEKQYRAALEVDPRTADAHHLLGVIALTRGQSAAAVDRITRAIQCNPAPPDYHQHLAMAHEAAGNLAAAIDAYRNRLARSPQEAAAHLELANALKAASQWTDAERHYRIALQIDDQLAAAHNNLGDSLHAQGRLSEALESFRTAAQLRPDSPEILFNLGNCYRDHKDFSEAADAYRACVALRPELEPAWRNLGRTFLDLEQPQYADECFRRALELVPDDIVAQNGRGAALQLMGRLDDAITCYRRALAVNPDDASVQFNFASALHTARRFREAQAAYEACARLDPANVDVVSNLGKCFQRMGKFDEASACYQRAVEIDPEFKNGHYLNGAMLLFRGDYEAGLPEFERGVNFDESASGKPRWNGEELNGRRILIHAPAGMGDTLQFARYVPMVESRGGKVILEVFPQLFSLLRHSGFRELVASGAAVPEHDVAVPMFSLPRIFGTRLNSIPATVPYLTPDERLVAQWGEWLSGETRFKVGIQWQGSALSITEGRSFPLATFESLARMPGVALFSLQVGAGREQLEQVPFRDAITDLGDHLRDVHDTAAVMRNLDLVIASDSAPAHLAGAIGVPVWMALQFVSDWRWQAERDTCPWYPTMRLFRQEVLDDWSAPFARIAAELQQLVGGGRR